MTMHNGDHYRTRLMAYPVFTESGHRFVTAYDLTNFFREHPAIKSSAVVDNNDRRFTVELKLVAARDIGAELDEADE